LGAFLKAGADNVIAGLWDVNDKSMMELMSRLYSEIAAGTDILVHCGPRSWRCSTRAAHIESRFTGAPFE